MGYRNKTYIAFEADTDILQYRMMTAWKANDKIEFDFHNAHELNKLRATSSEETIKRKLRERLNNTKLMIVLIGENTKNHHKFVRWEMDVAIDMDIPIVAVNLNNKRNMDVILCPSILKNHLALHTKYKQRAIQCAIDNWGNQYRALKNEGKTGPRVYSAEKYEDWAS